MIRTCDGTDPNLVDREGNPCDCGLIFDDVEMTVVYPHTQILGRAEKDALMEDLWNKVHVAPGVSYVWGTGSPTERAELEP
jgi:hypothetical protein